MFKKLDKIKTVDNWPTIDAGSAEPQLFANEAKLILKYLTSDRKIAVIVFPVIKIFKFGSPNDESLEGHPLYRKGLQWYKAHEVMSSSWILELEKQNSVHDRHDKKTFLKNTYHYIFTFHDSTLEIIANTSNLELAVKTFSNNAEATSFFNEQALNE